MNEPEDSIPIGPGHPGFDAAVRVSRLALAKRIAARAREEWLWIRAGAVTGRVAALPKELVVLTATNADNYKRAD